MVICEIDFEGEKQTARQLFLYLRLQFFQDFHMVEYHVGGVFNYIGPHKHIYNIYSKKYIIPFYKILEIIL